MEDSAGSSSDKDNTPQPAKPPEGTATPDIGALQRRVERMRKARKEAEHLLEEKSRQLYHANEELLNLSASLEERVDKRTRQLEERTEQALAATKQRERFAANISHELRSPLQGIIGFAKLGNKRADSTSVEKIRIYFDTISKSGETLLELVNDLLDLSKLNAGLMELDLAPIDFSNLLTEIRDEFKLRCRDKHLSLEVSINGDANVVADRFRILQVLRNLTSNAVKFSTPETTISMAYVRENSRVIINIDNTGVAIPEEEIAKIFDPFVESSETANKSGGTGLGLAICKEIVAAHNGEVKAQNCGTITRFTFTFPDNLGDVTLKAVA